MTRTSVCSRKAPLPKRLDITLSPEQHTALLEARDHHPKVYVRKKAAALLKMADEHLSALEVAQHRLLKRRDDNTVRSWLHRYLHEDWLAYLSDTDEAESQLFPPKHTAESSSYEVQEVLYRSPVLYGLDRHNWTLKDVGHTIDWMRPLNIPAVCKLVQRFKLVCWLHMISAEQNDSLPHCFVNDIGSSCLC